MAFIPYIFFNGKCEKAFEFYKKVTGGRIVGSLTYADNPDCGTFKVKDKRRLAHICLEADGAMLMGADVPAGYDCGAPDGFRVNFTVKTPAKAKKVFAVLVKGGKVQMPMNETFFAKAFGMCTDKFGTPWMVICPKQAPMKKKARKK